jgi:N-acetyl sugar amidotransferase
MNQDSNYGKPLFDNIEYCARCCVPETQEMQKFDDLGVCKACRSSEQKMRTNWAERQQHLKTILDEAKAKSGNNYDCILPISGGKDSFWQAHVLTKIYNLKPLAVTFSHNWYSKTGLYNLWNLLETFNLDHLMFTPNRGLVNRIAKRSLEKMGDSCWHCHAGIGPWVINMAIKLNIPLIVYGESLAEQSGKSTYDEYIYKFDLNYSLKVSAGSVLPQDMVCDYISRRDLFPFEHATPEDYKKASVNGIFLADFLFWDDEKQTEFVRDAYGWKETQMEGTYKGYKSAECIMPGMHDFTCYLKRGFGRSTWHSSMDVRNGMLTRDEAFELVRKHDPEIPEALDYYLKITGLSEEEFYATMEKQRHEKLKGVTLPVVKKGCPNGERIVPYVQQMIDEMKNEKDVREQGNNKKV